MSSLALFAVTDNLRINGRKIEILADSDFDLRPGSVFVTPLRMLSGPQGMTYSINTPAHILHRRGHITGVAEDSGNVMIFFTCGDGNISIAKGDVLAVITPVLALIPALVPAEGKLANGQTFAYDDNGVMRFSEAPPPPPPAPGTITGKITTPSTPKRAKKKKKS